MNIPVQAGWIVYCDGSIYGVGDTMNDALADAREWADDWDGQWWRAESREQSGLVYAAPATKRLIDAARNSNPWVAHIRVGVNGLRDLADP